jgi:uncharacterized membrane protein YebE (DUF533 family)
MKDSTKINLVLAETTLLTAVVGYVAYKAYKAWNSLSNFASGFGG